MPNDPQVPWTDEQWARVNQVIQEEANRARVAAGFLPLFGPLPPDTDFIRREEIEDDDTPIRIADREIIQLATLQVRVSIRGAQIADPEMRSVLALFRRAANVLGRLEDAIVFSGQIDRDQGPPHGAPPQGAPPYIWQVHGGQESPGLFRGAADQEPVGYVIGPTGPDYDLVTAVSSAIGRLERNGYFGPFAVVLGQRFFLSVQTPSIALVLPQDRIIPFLGGGPLLRSTTLRSESEEGIEEGVVVALGGSPVELVISKDVSLQFLQLTDHPRYHFRVYEKMALRIKAPKAIRRLVPTLEAARAVAAGAAPSTPAPGHVTAAARLPPTLRQRTKTKKRSRDAD
jgi:uncharacterized linocin/CFP29 family protein